MPTLSVIIATSNRCSALKECLESLLKQESDGSFVFDVIIADNNSKDQTKDVAESYRSRFNDRLQYVFEPIQGKAHALNKGIQAAKGDILVFTDDDVVTDSRWLMNLVQCFTQYKCDGVGGRILPTYPPETPSWVKANARQLAGPIVLYDLGEDVKKYEKPALEFLGANFAFKRQVFDDCGLFRTDIGPGKGVMGEDTEMVNRAIRANKVLYYSGKALVWHPVDPKRMTLRYLARWYVALGRYRFLIDEKGILDRGLACCCGVPRYLIREIAEHSLMLIPSFFHKPKLLKRWKDLTVAIGRVSGIRQKNLEAGEPL